MQRVFRYLPALLLSLLVALPITAEAKYPEREVRMIIPWNPGGSNDLMARVIQPVMEREGVKMVVENIPGGSSAIGLGQVANAKPDGYTLGWATSSILSLMAEGKVPLKMSNYTTLVKASEDDLILIVSKNSPHKDLTAFMDNIKANPGKVTIGTPGARTLNDLLAISAAGAVGSTQRSVPYSGGSRAVAELLGGHINGAILKPGESMQVIKSGDAIPIGIFTDKRSQVLADVPTFKELGYNAFPYGPLKQISFIVGPANLPEEVKTVLIKALTAAYKSPEFKKFCDENVVTIDPISGKELDDQINAVIETLRTVLGKMNADAKK